MRRLSLFAVLALASPAAAVAQPSDAKAIAEQLFSEGRDAGKRGDWAAACPKFEASLRYDPALGTRLNLATCYEKVGKVASAWALFKESMDLARKAGDESRRRFAADQIALLEPRLPKLTIKLTGAAPPGLVVTRSGTTVDPTLYGSALIVDPGEQEIVAAAPGHEPFVTSLVVAERARSTVDIPALTPRRASEPADGDPGAGDAGAGGSGGEDGAAGGEAPVDPPDDEPVDTGGGGSGRRTIGLVTAGAGLVAIGVGSYFAISAGSTFDDAKALCGGDLQCDTQADLEASQAKVDDARGQALGATVLLGVGAAAVVTGGVLYFTAPGRQRVERRALSVTPVLGRQRATLVLGGRF